MAQFCALSGGPNRWLRRDTSPARGRHAADSLKVSRNKNPASMDGIRMLCLLQIGCLQKAQHFFLLRPVRRKVDSHQALPCEGCLLSASHDRINNARR